MIEFRAYEICEPAEPRAPFMFTCEHASNTLPPGITGNAEDRVLLEDHWGWDIGARLVTLHLAERFGAPAVLSTFSRLVADPNRVPADPSFVVTEIDGFGLSFNRDLTSEERRRRAELYAEPYHAAVAEAGRTRRDLGVEFRVVSVHSFTPLYRGARRTMDIGVLFDEHEEPAVILADALCDRGLGAVLNEPYSGRGGGSLIYSAQRHGRELGVEYLELEIRQDLIATPEASARVAESIADALTVLGEAA